ncbi:uncharacterized protein B0H18DRAFT_408934 [Fomitopsis serialis]|uniref:uncharacterized protein n=1 Tax=Fomitopsis serialis TaxID=139415 RepID=UPI002007FFB3|nr:uncharacterized protein B0H18DRAFT_408934 [Neoantrodia serialis]KAH9935292.1 hypothetical protein B0H18DRAFT_408934 [Neoantrodia serialis]
MRRSPHAPASSEYLIAENTTRISDDYIQVSLKVAMSNPGDDHFSFGCFSRTPRPSTPSGGANAQRRGRFPGGRSVLPPLHLPFRASRSPVPDPSFQFAQQDQTRNDYGVPAYGQQGWSINPQAGYQQQTQYPPNDPRYSAQFAPYPGRPSSSMLPEQHDSRTLPPLNMQPGQPHPGYASYPEGHQPPSHGSFYAPQPPDPRNLPPPIPSTMGYDPAAGMLPRRSSMSVDRTASTRLSVHGTSPYPRIPRWEVPSHILLSPRPRSQLSRRSANGPMQNSSRSSTRRKPYGIPVDRGEGRAGQEVEHVCPECADMVPEQTPGNAAELPSSRRSRSTNDERALPYVVARP